MRIFISWSGERSKGAALALRDWLPDVMQFAKPWVSEVDIPTGAHWPRALGDELAQSDAGVICVTRDNQAAPWLLFEAGALARNFKEQSRVCVFLVDLNPIDLQSGPLTLYQSATIDQEDAWKLVLSLNEIAGEDRLEKERLRRAFDRSWPDVHARLTALQSSQPVGEARSEREILEELLSGVRSIQRDMSSLYLRPAEPYVAPRTGVEEKLSKIWSDVLQLGRISVHDNFFALGGHSLLATQLISRIRRDFGVSPPLASVFQYPTIEGFAELIKGMTTDFDAGAV